MLTEAKTPSYFTVTRFGLFRRAVLHAV